MFDSMFKSLWWSMGVGTSFPLGSLLENILGASSNVNAIFLTDPTFNSIFNSVQELSYTLITIVGFICLIFSLVVGNMQATKKFIKNMLMAGLGIALLTFPIQLSGSIMDLMTPCKQGECTSDIQNSFIINLVNPFLFRVDETGQIIDSDGHAKGTSAFNEDKVYNVITGNNADTDTLYTKDYEGCEKGKSSCKNMKFNANDVKQLKQGNNYAFDVTLNGEVNGVKFHYDYSSVFLMLFGNSVLFIMFGFSFIKMLLKVLNFIFVLAWSMIVNVVAVIKGSGAYKELFSTIFKLILGVELQFIYLTMLGSLMNVTISATSEYGIVIMILSLGAIAIFMVDGPDQITKLFDIDLGASSPVQTYMAGKAAAMGVKGVKKSGSAIGNIPGIKGMSDGIKTGAKQGSISKGISDLNDKVARKGYSASQKMTGGKGKNGLSYEDFKKQQELKNKQTKDGGNMNTNNEAIKNANDNMQNDNSNTNDVNGNIDDLEKSTAFNDKTNSINPNDIIGKDIKNEKDNLNKIFDSKNDENKKLECINPKSTKANKDDNNQFGQINNLEKEKPENYSNQELSKKVADGKIVDKDDDISKYKDVPNQIDQPAEVKSNASTNYSNVDATNNMDNLNNKKSINPNDKKSTIKSKPKANQVSRPSQKQINYANELGIKNPNSYSKKDLSQKIDTSVKEKASMGKYKEPTFEKIDIDESKVASVEEVEELLGVNRK